MTRLSGGTATKPTRTGSTTRRPAGKKKAISRRGGVLLEPLPTMLASCETEAKPEKPTEPTEEQIRLRAYQFYEQRGREPGHDVEDWMRAEHELRSRRAA